ncbi:hypothetical protein V6N13_067152 [Hibiscus sabdariffa]
MPGLRLWGLTNEAELWNRAWKYQTPLMEPSLSSTFPKEKEPDKAPTCSHVETKHGPVSEKRWISIAGDENGQRCRGKQFSDTHSRSQWFYSSISIDVVKMQTLGVLQAPLLSLQHNEIPSLLLRSGLK